MNLLTHVDWYAEYYTNQEYGLLFWHRDENERFNLQNLSLSSRNKAFYRFAYSNRFEPRMAYSRLVCVEAYLTISAGHAIEG